MANVTGTNPLVIDTAADNIFAPNTNVKISGFKWIPSAIDQVVLVEDGKERAVWGANTTEIGTVANAILPQPQQNFVPPITLQGLSVGTLTTGGTLYIYLAQPVG